MRSVMADHQPLSRSLPITHCGRHATHHTHTHFLSLFFSFLLSFLFSFLLSRVKTINLLNSSLTESEVSSTGLACVAEAVTASSELLNLTQPNPTTQPPE